MTTTSRIIPGITEERICVGKQTFITLKAARDRFPNHYVGLPQQLTRRISVLFKGVVARPISADRALAAFRLDELKIQFAERADEIYEIERLESLEGERGWKAHFKLGAPPEVDLKGINANLAALVRDAVKREVYSLLPEKVEGRNFWAIEDCLTIDKDDARTSSRKIFREEFFGEKFKALIAAIVRIQERLINNQPVLI